MNQGKLIILDAIDGAGKSTVINGIANWLKEQGKTVFDLQAFQKEHHALPESESIDADVLLSAEPTYSWVGAAIRDEIIKSHSGRSYHGRAAAEAFALDRQVLFTRVILPFLSAKPNRWVIQDRGLITSLAYQPLQDERVTLDWLLSLEGNRAELSRPPDLLLLLRLTPEVAMQRLAGRTQKKDDHIYENPSFQEQLALRYRDTAVLAPYANAGSKVVEIDASQPPEQVAKSAIDAIVALG